MRSASGSYSEIGGDSQVQAAKAIYADPGFRKSATDPQAPVRIVAEGGQALRDSFAPTLRHTWPKCGHGSSPESFRLRTTWLRRTPTSKSRRKMPRNRSRSSPALSSPWRVSCCSGYGKLSPNSFGAAVLQTLQFESDEGQLWKSMWDPQLLPALQRESPA